MVVSALLITLEHALTNSPINQTLFLENSGTLNSLFKHICHHVDHE